MLDLGPAGRDVFALASIAQSFGSAIILRLPQPPSVLFLWRFGALSSTKARKIFAARSP